MMLTGTYARSLDDKLRFAVPKRIRDVMLTPESSALYLAPGTDHSLMVYGEMEFERMAEQLGRSSPTAADVRAFSRLFYARAERVELDGQGRLRLPAELARLASIGREIVLLGVRDHLEIWDVESWRRYHEEMQPHYDSIAESAFAAGMIRGQRASREEAVPVDDHVRSLPPR